MQVHIYEDAEVVAYYIGGQYPLVRFKQAPVYLLRPEQVEAIGRAFVAYVAKQQAGTG